jgi:hypothetical protein
MFGLERIDSPKEMLKLGDPPGEHAPTRATPPSSGRRDCQAG